MERFTAVFIIVLCVILTLCSCFDGDLDEGGVIFYDEEPFEVIGYDAMQLSGNYNEFNSVNINSPFYTDKDDNIIYTINALWRRFGDLSDGANAVHLIGNEPTWYEWMTKKFLWSDAEEAKQTLKLLIRNCPQSENGYLWSWGDREYWLVQDTFKVDDPQKDSVAYHFDGTFRFIAAVHDVIASENSPEFLFETDLTRANSRDFSQNKTVREKLDNAIEFILNDLGGKNGYITLPEDMDISPPMRQYLLNTGNTGRLGGNSSNYWDNYCFGHISGYENALFYNTLIKLHGIEMMCGNEDKAGEYLELAATVKQKYDEYFWEEAKGRYINTVDIDGRKHDYGLTFQNTEALTYGLGDKDKAKSIFGWLDGERIIDTDTSKGEDIYFYKVAPRTNTLAIESIVENGKTWWKAPASINVLNNGNASWNKHQTNGGFIFYSEYYDIMARRKYIGPESFLKRWDAIYREYAIDGLYRKNSWQYGLIGEFPENGIVPISFLEGLMGIKPTYRGLEIAPVFPQAYNLMGVQKYCYGKKYYGVSVEKEGTLIIETQDGFDLKLVYRPNVSKADFSVKIYDESGNQIYTNKVKKDSDYEISLDLSGNIYQGNLRLVVS